jgi:Ca2+:H+ antiporter
MGEGVGGLLNATFGNAAELIIAVVALSKGLTGVVKASITGSIIGNILLVFGLSILCGGTKYREQNFNRTGARTSAICLSLAAIALIIPTVFHIAAERVQAAGASDRAATLVRDRHRALLHLLLRAWISPERTSIFSEAPK